MSPAPSRARSRPDLPRLVAWRLLRAVDERQAYANLLLPKLIEDEGERLDARDRMFITELGYGALRWQGSLDLLLSQGMSRPLDAVDPPVRDALRLGAYQLLRTRVPARAAVASTVELVRTAVGEHAVRFANAVLRRAAERVEAAGGDTARALAAPARDTDPVGYLAAVHAHPRWIVEAFADVLGGDLARTERVLAADNEAPRPHLVARPGRMDRDDLLAQAEDAGLGATVGRWSPYAVRLEAGEPALLPAVRDGRAGVQDEGSQLVALALARATVASSAGAARGGLTVDLCAGPGGKAALLAGLLPGLLLAIEPRAARARLVRDALPDGATVRADGRQPPVRPGSADRVLVDAPCTGLGALRRRPEARWRRTPDDLARLTALQRDLLASALTLVRPGGVVCYATCSPHRAETSEVVEAVLAGRADIDRIEMASVLPGVPGTGSDLQLWPDETGTDAMFASLLRRR
ncbi:MAG: RsmB/NOP family class I SAM-dependent RNA methyltransferase [Frankiaceae bacterium]